MLLYLNNITTLLISVVNATRIASDVTKLLLYLCKCNYDGSAFSVALFTNMTAI